METIFGWVLCGDISPGTNSQRVTTYHSIIRSSDDDIIRKFWEIEETPNKLESNLSIEECYVVNHYKTSHIRKSDGRYIVPKMESKLLANPDPKPFADFSHSNVR
jgi:hypothetical protein